MLTSSKKTAMENKSLYSKIPKCISVLLVNACIRYIKKKRSCKFISGLPALLIDCIVCLKVTGTHLILPELKRHFHLCFFCFFFSSFLISLSTCNLGALLQWQWTCAHNKITPCACAHFKTLRHPFIYKYHICIYPTPLHGQDVTQGQSLSGV